VLVRFVLPARGAKRVALAGDFNGWRTDDVLLRDERGDGVFSATVALPPGRHSYLFWVDGRWQEDPAASASLPDGFGRRNSILEL
jgi:1,4-alpha-glucan branching enzyme